MADIPEHLKPNDRPPDQSFLEDDALHRGFELAEYDSANFTIRTETIKFPDFSCNWSRYSEPADIKYRRNGKDTDGCYSFTVRDSQYDSLATPVHDPIDDEDFPNYSHTEVRVRKQDAPLDVLPEKGRKINSKSKKLAYRTNLTNKLGIEFMPIA